MRFAGVPNAVRFRGLAAHRMYDGLGALPENLQNSLYPVGTPNTNYSEVIGNPMWDLMKQLAAQPYPTLPYAGPGVQNPWGTSATAGYAFSSSGTMVTSDGNTMAVSAPTGGTSGGGGGGGGTKMRTQLKGLSGLGDLLPLASPFPYRIKDPFVSGNNFWYTGQPTLNKGEPKYVNDAMEFLRSAVVDSDWDRVEAWLGWALQNGMTRDKLTMFDFGRMKYTGTAAAKKYYPFSKTDIRSFYERFLRFTAQSSPADRTCIQNKYDMAMRAADSSPRNQFVLRLSDCPLTEGWEKALLKMVALVAIPVAIAFAATAIVGVAAAGSAGGAGAVGAAGAAGGAGAAGAAGATAVATAIPVGVEVVTVAATALPVIGAGTAAAVSAGAALAAGSVIAAAAPPPIAPPEIAPPPTAIETVTVTAAPIAPIAPVVPVATAGAAIGASAVVATSTPPPIVQPSPAAPSETIETVTVEASAAPPPPFPILTAASAIPGIAAIVLNPPTIEVPEPTLNVDEQEPSLSDRVRDGLTDAVEQYGSDYVSQQLAEYLQGLLGRQPTPGELDDWQNWLDAGADPDNAPGSGVSFGAWLLLGAVLAIVAYDSFGRRKGSRRS